MTGGRFNVQLTQGAEGDLESIFDYLAANHSVEQATTLLSSFLSKIETLEHFPWRGGIPKELDALGIREFRQLSMKPYRLIYRIVDDDVYVMVIADGRRDMQSLLEERILGRGI